MSLIDLDYKAGSHWLVLGVTICYMICRYVVHKSATACTTGKKGGRSHHVLIVKPKWSKIVLRQNHQQTLPSATLQPASSLPSKVVAVRAKRSPASPMQNCRLMLSSANTHPISQANSLESKWITKRNAGEIWKTGSAGHLAIPAWKEARTAIWCLWTASCHGTGPSLGLQPDPGTLDQRRRCGRCKSVQDLTHVASLPLPSRHRKSSNLLGREIANWLRFSQKEKLFGISSPPSTSWCLTWSTSSESCTVTK